MTARFNAIGMVVSDMTATLAFYRLLGVDIPAGAEKEPHVDVAFPGGFRLMWDTEETIRSFDPQWQPPAGAGRLELAFECDSPADLDKLYADVVAAGHGSHKEPWDAFWGQRYAVVEDPDGNKVDLYAALEP